LAGNVAVVRAADITVGVEYAHEIRTYSSDDPQAARVRVLTRPASGQVRVLVLDVPSTRSRDGSELTVGKETDVSTRALVNTWADWEAAAPARAEARRAREEQRRQWEAEMADATLIRPDRNLTPSYDSSGIYRWHDIRILAEDEPELIVEYRSALQLGPYADDTWLRDVTLELFDGLPKMLRRDLLAATAARRGHRELPACTVGAVLRRAAALLEDAYYAARSAGATRAGREPGGRELGARVDEAVTPAAAAFLQNLAHEAAASGGELRLPATPRLSPHLDPDGHAPLGWLRVAVAETSGSKLHTPGCRQVNAQSLIDADTMPLWQLLLRDRSDICGVCGGPRLTHLVELAHFAAAVDVWDARGRTGLEPWQRRAAGHLIGATTSERMGAGEPDIPAAARVVDALADGAPGANGWDAYYLVRSHGRQARERVQEMTDPQRAAASQLAVDRLNAATAALPTPLRRIPLTASATSAQLAERFDLLATVVTERDALDLLLFTLPGSYRSR
jgi:hypothetical protein